jgi:Tfp pilus assembly protein PilF
MYKLLSARRHIIIIERFIVAEELAKCGFTSEVIARKIRDRLLDISDISGTERQHERLAMNQYLPVIKIQSPGFSLSKVLSSLRLNIKHQITGELVSYGSLIALTVRVEGSPAQTASGPLNEIDDLINRSAMDLIRRTDPYVLAAYCLVKGDTDRVLELVHYCISKLPANQVHWALNLWGVYFLERGEYRKAADCFRRALKLYPDFGIALFNLALAIDGADGSLDECVDLYRKAARQWKSSLVWHGLGNALLRQQLYAEASEVFEKADKLSPHDPLILKHWGDALYQEGRYKEALEKLSLASIIDRKNPQLKYAIGQIFEQLGEIKKAVQEYEEAVRIDENHRGARARLNELKQLSQDLVLSTGGDAYE